MSILNNIIKTAKELYEADENGNLGDYVNDKISTITNKLDGTEDMIRESEYDDILNLLDENFDIDQFQVRVTEWFNCYGNNDSEILRGYILSYLGWNKYYHLRDEELKENYDSLPWQEYEEQRDDCNSILTKCLECLNEAINLDSENLYSCLCWLCTQKAYILHQQDEHCLAVRTAIYGIQYADNEEEKQNALGQISGLQNGELCPLYGYGVRAEDKETFFEKYYEGEPVEFDTSSWEKFVEEVNNYAYHIYAEGIDSDLKSKRFLSNRPYYERQFILTIRDINQIVGCYDEKDNIRYVFPMNELPKDICFPVGHPLPNTLYLAHPLRNYYIPFDDAPTVLFHEKIHEICRLMQCLGATEITARCVQGEKLSEETLNNNEINVKGNQKIYNGAIGVRGDNSFGKHTSRNNEMSIHQSFNPIGKPYCPNDLIWAKKDPELQTLIRQRLEGGLLSFSKTVSSMETCNMSSSLAVSVNASFESIMIGIDANCSHSSSNKYAQTKETIWEITAEFKPFDDAYKPESTNKILDGEKPVYSNIGILPLASKEWMLWGELNQDIHVGDNVLVSNDSFEYETSVKGVFMFFKILDQGEKGDICGLLLDNIYPMRFTPDTKVYLINSDNNEDKLDVTPVNAQTLQWTPDEESYAEEVRFCLEDGNIGDKERRFLNRMRDKLRISPERAIEIENSLQTPSFTEDEKEYLDAMQEEAVNGSIPEKSRRILNRFRISLGISEERAAELEKYIK